MIFYSLSLAMTSYAAGP